MNKKKSKDPWQEIIDQIDEYTDGTPPRSIKEYGCTCGKEFKEDHKNH